MAYTPQNPFSSFAYAAVDVARWSAEALKRRTAPYLQPMFPASTDEGPIPARGYHIKSFHRRTRIDGEQLDGKQLFLNEETEVLYLNGSIIMKRWRETEGIQRRVSVADKNKRGELILNVDVVIRDGEVSLNAVEGAFIRFKRDYTAGYGLMEQCAGNGLPSSSISRESMHALVFDNLFNKYLDQASALMAHAEDFIPTRTWCKVTTRWGQPHIKMRTEVDRRTRLCQPPHP